MKIVKGDLFDFPVVAHGCNAKGVMGAGIARVFAQKFPNMLYTYEMLCGQELLAGGDVHAWKEDGVIGFNIITQTNPGADANAGFIYDGLSNAIDIARYSMVDQIAIPLIGCGIGGLEWEKDLKPIVEALDGTCGVELIVVTL